MQKLDMFWIVCTCLILIMRYMSNFFSFFFSVKLIYWMARVNFGVGRWFNQSSLYLYHWFLRMSEQMFDSSIQQKLNNFSPNGYNRFIENLLRMVAYTEENKVVWISRSNTIIFSITFSHRLLKIAKICWTLYKPGYPLNLPLQQLSTRYFSRNDESPDSTCFRISSAHRFANSPIAYTQKLGKSVAQ